MSTEDFETYTPKPLFAPKKVEPYMPKPLFGNSTTQTSKPKNESSSVSGPKPVQFGPAKAQEPAPVPKPVSPKLPRVEPSKGPLKTPKTLFGGETLDVDSVTAQDRLTFKGFSDIDIAKIKKLAKEIDLKNRSNILVFGDHVVKSLVKAVDEILEFVRKNSALTSFDDEVNKLVSLAKIDFSKEPPPEKLFGFIKVKSTVSTTDRVNEVIDAINKTSDIISDKIKSMFALTPQLERLLEVCKKSHNELRVAIAAGKLKLDEVKASRVKILEEQLQLTNVLIAHNARDELDLIALFEKRAQTLEQSLLQNEMTLAQIRMTQNTNSKTIEMMSNAVNSLVPEWKKNLIMALTTNNFAAANATSSLLLSEASNIITK